MESSYISARVLRAWVSLYVQVYLTNTVAWRFVGRGLLIHVWSLLNSLPGKTVLILLAIKQKVVLHHDTKDVTNSE